MGIKENDKINVGAENKSILDQIINNNQAEEVAKLDAIEIINDLFGKLNERERDVLVRRFGLHGHERETLEEIGKIHSLTRERIRQIETSGIKRLRQIEDLDNHLLSLKNIITHLLEEHGGLMEKEYLFNNLVSFSLGADKKDESEIKHKRHFDFLISKLLHEEFEEIKNSELFKESFKLKYHSLEHLEALAEELLAKIKDTKKLFMTEDLINLSKELGAYKANLEKFNLNNSLDVSGISTSDLFQEPVDSINKNKAIYTILQAAKKLEQNKFGHWGISEWREIKPKTINDKIYLILKNNGKPMHFAAIADKINKIGFDKKKANAATVHNELILDEKYILVGRGLYGLKEWGYKKGTVVEVIESVIINSGVPLSREEVVNKVLEQRMVKKATINLALMNKNRFELTPDGKYGVKRGSDK
ncbi:MAG: sigma factor-like helix-turn-helix DNA-binding protein [Patescibacteria group bacterium]|nr:sigma factor-like helix-turn-helix DNA-binding protein [Patescibacteria group bacterium]